MVFERLLLHDHVTYSMLLTYVDYTVEYCTVYNVHVWVIIQ